jgi:hypothetical protein
MRFDGLVPSVFPISFFLRFDKKIFKLKTMKKILFFTILSTVLFSCAQKNSKGYELLDAKSFNARLEQTEKKQIIDVRTPEEFGTGNIPQSQNINIYCFTHIKIYNLL